MASFFAPSWYLLSWSVIKQLYVNAFRLSHTSFMRFFGGIRILLLPFVGLLSFFMKADGISWKFSDKIFQRLSEGNLAAAVNGTVGGVVLSVLLAVCLWHVIKTVHQCWQEGQGEQAAPAQPFSYAFFPLLALWLGVMWGCFSIFIYNEPGARISGWKAFKRGFVLILRLIPYMFLVAIGFILCVAVLCVCVWLCLKTFTNLDFDAVVTFLREFFIRTPSVVIWGILGFFVFISAAGVFFQVAYLQEVYARLHEKFPELFAEKALNNEEARV